MHTASVGFHCPECVKQGKQKVYTASSLLNARPVMTQILIGLNVLAFLVGIALGDGVQGSASRDGLLVDGAAWGLAIDVGGEWWRIFTSGFLHYGLFHLGFNMYALWFLGGSLEKALGRLRFGLVYFAALLGGSFGALLVSPGSATAGASGAIFGLFGVAALAQRAAGISIWDSGIGMVLVLNFVLTFGVRSISVGGHVGGFLVGLLAGALIYSLPRTVKVPKYATEAALVAIGAICFVGALWASTTWDNPIF